jgi:CBS domain-containing protein
MIGPVLDPNRPGPSLSQLTVMETMHPGVVSCPSATPLRVVARMLAAHRIHAVIVFAEHRAAEPSEWSVVSDIDIVHSASLGDVESATAGGTAATPVVIVSPDDTLDHAARLMVENKTTHLIVVDPRSVRPIGVLSTLDVARALGELP